MSNFVVYSIALLSLGGSIAAFLHCGKTNAGMANSIKLLGLCTTTSSNIPIEKAMCSLLRTIVDRTEFLPDESSFVLRPHLASSDMSRAVNEPSSSKPRLRFEPGSRLELGLKKLGNYTST